MTIKRTPEKTTLLSVAQYQGLARPGEIVIDETTYQMYVANATGALNVVGTGAGGNVTLTQIVNGASNVAIPLAGANIQVGVSGAPNVVNFSPTQIDVKANIVPVGDAVYSLGSPTAQFKDLYLSNTTLYLNLVPITVSGTKLAVNGANVLTDDGTGNTPFTGNIAVAGNITAANITTPGNVSAQALTTSLAITANGGVVSDVITGRTGGIALNAGGTNQNITLNPSGTGVVDATNSRISNVATPTADADAVNKAYVDAVLSGLLVHQAVACATTATLGGTYTPGSGGVGATFTTTTPISFIDNYALQIGDRVLIKNQVQPWENGVYTRTSTSIFTRVSDLDEPTEFDRAYFFVSSGTQNGRTGWVQSGSVVTVGGSAVVFYQFNAAATYTAGLGLSLSGTAFSLQNSGVTPGVYGNARSVASVTVDVYGRITNISNVIIDSNSANLTGSALSSNITTSNIQSLGTLTALNVGGVANLGPVANVRISGGTAGQVLTTTDGAGNLAWAPFPLPVSIANGVSNINIPIGGGNIVFTAGTANPANVTAFGIVAANLTANANVTTSNLTVTARTVLGSIGNVKISGGASGDVIVTDGLGNLTFQTGGGGGGGSVIANGTTNVNIPVSSSNVKITVNGVADVVDIGVLGLNMPGTLTAGNALITGNLTVSGTTNYVNVSTLQVSNPVIQLGGGANGTPLTTNDGKDRGTQLQYYTTQQVSAFMGWDNSAGEFAFGSNVTNASDVMTFNTYGNVRAGVFFGDLDGGNIKATISANLGAVTGVKISGGSSGQFLQTDGFGTLSWATPAAGISDRIANGTSSVSIPVSGAGVITTSNGYVIANFYSDSAGARTITLSGNVVFGTSIGNIDLTNAAVANLGAIGNLRLGGGTSGQLLSSNGSGGLSWTNPSAGSIIANGFSNVTIPASSGNVTVFSGGIKLLDANTTQIGIQNGIDLVLGTGNANLQGATKTYLGAVGNVVITGGTSGQVLTTDGSGGLSWTSGGGGSGSIISNGTSNVTIPNSSGAVVINSNGVGMISAWKYGAAVTDSITVFDSGQIEFKGAGGNLKFGTSAGTGFANVDFTYVSNVKLGSNSNVFITGGTNGQVLTTDGSGGLSWTTPGGTALANGTSNVVIPAVDGTVVINSNGQQLATFYSDTTQRTTILNERVLFAGNGNPGGGNVAFGDSGGPLANVDFTYTSKVILGPVANVEISGGTNGQVLTTDGAGVLSWTSGGGGGLSNGTSNVSIPTINDAILIYSNGLSVATFWSDGTNRVTGIQGNLNVFGNGLLTGGGFVKFGQGPAPLSNVSFEDTLQVSLGPAANLRISGGTSGQVLTSNGSGGVSWAAPSAGSGIANGTSNVTIPSINSFVNIFSNGIQIATFDNDGTTSTTSFTGDAILYGTGTSNFRVGGAGPGQNFAVADFTYTSNVTLGPVANVHITGGTAGQVLSTDGSGTLTWVAAGSAGNNITNGTSNVIISTSGGNIRAYVGGNLFQTWAYNSSSTTDEVQFNTPIVRAASGSYVLFDAAAQTWLGSPSNIVISGGTSGQVLRTDGSGALSWVDGGKAILNGSSNVTVSSSNGPIDSYVSGSLVSRLDASNLTMYGGNIIPSSNTTGNLGDVSGKYWDNVLANTGIFANSVRTNGIKLAGSITWLGAGTLGDLGDSSTSGTFKNTYSSNVYVANIYPPSGVNDITVVGANLLPNANGVYNLGSPTMRWAGAYFNATTIYLGNSSLSVDATSGNLEVNGNSVVVQNTTSGNTVIEGNIVAPGDITSNGNVVAGNLITAGTLDVSGSANLGAVGNLVITGGSNGQVLTTNGSGGLSWTTVSGGGGSSNTIYATISNIANANMILQAVGEGYDPGNGNIQHYAQTVWKFTNPSGSNTQLGSFYAYQNTASALGNFTTGMYFELGEVFLGASNSYGSGETSIFGANVSISAGVSGNVQMNYSNLLLPSPQSISMGIANAGEVLGYDDVTGKLKWVSGGGGGNTGNIVFTQSQMQSNVSYNLLNLDYSGGVRFGTAGDEPILFIMNSGQANGKLDKVWTLYDGTLSSNSTIGMYSGNVIEMQAPNISLGTVSNIHITGGSNGQVLTTDGSGGLSWTTVSGGGGGSSISNASTSINTFANRFMLNADGSTIFTGWGDSTSPFGNIGGMFGGWRYDMFPGAIWNYSNAANVTLGAVGNVKITGGSNGQVLTTNGSGGLSWTTVSGGGGNSITADGGNVAVSVSKNANGDFFANTTFYDSYADETKTLISAFGAHDSANSTYTPVIQFGSVSFTPPAPPVFKTVSAQVFGNFSVSAGNTVGLGGNTITLSSSNLLFNNSKWPSGYGNNNQVLTTDGTGNLSWANAGGGGSSSIISNVGSSVWIPEANGYISITAVNNTNDGVHVWNFNRNGNLQLPNVGNAQMSVSGTTRKITADPHPASGTGSVVVWTASGSDVCGAKMTLRAKNIDGNVQMMEIMMAKNINNTNVNWTVSNRVKSDDTATDIPITVSLSSNTLRVTATVGVSHTFTYTVDEFATL